VLQEATPLADFNLVEKWSAPVPWYWLDASITVANLTDDNGDGRIDLCDMPDLLVFTKPYRFPGEMKLTVLSGNDGSELPFDQPAGALSSLAPAIADLDADGVPEILVANAEGHTLALTPTGEVLWESSVDVLGFLDAWASAFAVHDLDGDGSPEILVGFTVLDAHGNLLFADPTQGSEFDGTLQTTYALRPTAVDLDGDGQLEVLLGYVTYSATGEELWRLDTGPGWAQPGDFDGDGVPEILFTNPEGVWLISATGEILWGPLRPPDEAEPPREFCWSRPAALADLDGDGLPEAIMNTCDKRFVAKIRLEGIEILASEAVPITTLFATPAKGSTAFDFRGTSPDWLAFDHTSLALHDGFGAVAQEFSTSGTGINIPIVADVDNDGSADIVIYDTAARRVRVYEDAEHRPSPARRIWNQWNYWGSNVREDATIPAHPPMPWQTHNTFRTQLRRGVATVIPPR